MTTFAYIRCSTAAQDKESQDHAVAPHDPDRIFEDTGTGANTDRPALQELLSVVQEGDVIVTYKLDRISRSVVDLLNIVRYLNECGVELVSTTEALDTRTAMGRFT